MQELEKERIRRLVDAASKLLIIYEQELTAYYTVFKAAKERIPSNLFAFDYHFSEILGSVALAAEAEAEYGELEPLLHPISDAELSAALDRAASALERRLASRKT